MKESSSSLERDAESVSRSLLPFLPASLAESAVDIGKERDPAYAPVAGARSLFFLGGLQLPLKFERDAPQLVVKVLMSRME